MSNLFLAITTALAINFTRGHAFLLWDLRAFTISDAFWEEKVLFSYVGNFSRIGSSCINIFLMHCFCCYNGGIREIDLFVMPDVVPLEIDLIIYPPPPSASMSWQVLDPNSLTLLMLRLFKLIACLPLPIQFFHISIHTTAPFCNTKPNHYLPHKCPHSAIL